MTPERRARVVRVLDAAPLLLFGLVIALFGAQSDRFLTLSTAGRILEQAAPIIVVASGMTVVLLTAGVDLSVGAVMFIGAAVAGHLARSGQPVAVCALAMVGIGMLCGGVNALLVTRLRLPAFVATLATLYIGRGLGRVITETRAMNLPDSFLALGATRILEVPVPVWIAAGVAVAGQFVLSSTPFGRQLYALGSSPDAARAIGLPTHRCVAAVYIISGACAGLGGLLALSQLGAVSPRFGEFYEFDAITASVLGGTSLFGGQGRIIPGAVLGALLVKTIFAGLVMVQADPYLYPMVTAGIIFTAVLVDSLRRRLSEHLTRRLIRPLGADVLPPRTIGG